MHNTHPIEQTNKHNYVTVRSVDSNDTIKYNIDTCV